jgi:4-hydroxy-tetrahydrodipicolinate synthase
MLYDIPVRTGRKIDTSTLLRLFDDVPNIVAVKDAAGDPAETARLIAQAGDRVEVYSGDDAMTLPLLAVGAVGVVSVASHWVGSEMGAMVAAFRAGDVQAARHLNQAMLESFEFEAGLDSPNPIPTKAMLRHLGLPVGACRLPMGPEPKGLDVSAAEVWDAVLAHRSAASQ